MNAKAEQAVAAAQGRARFLLLPIACGLIVVACGAYGLSALWPMLDEAWSNIYGAFSHGYLVLALCVWLGVRYWKAFPPQQLQPAWPALVLLLALVFALVGMDVLFLNSTRLSVLPLIFLASVALVFGWSAARTLFWPSVFLYLALPQWWAINGTLQTLTSKIVSALVNATGLPAYVEGNFIRVPAGMFEIASGCSGLNYLVAALSLAGFYALMYLDRWKSRAMLLAAAAAAAMLSNFTRIYSLIVIGIATDMQHYLIRVEHLYFGWVLFMVSMIPVFWLARKLDDEDASKAADEPSKDPSRTRVSVLAGASIIPAAIAAGLVLIVPRLVTLQTAGASVTAPELPMQLGTWHGQTVADSVWRPAFVNATESHAQYVRESHVVQLFRASYAHQTHDARLISSDNNVGGSGWRLAEQASINIADAAVHRVTEARGYLNERERLIWSWYVVAGEPVASKLGAKLQELRGFVQRRRDAAGFAISTECVPSCSEARERLTDFMQESAASLQ